MTLITTTEVTPTIQPVETSVTMSQPPIVKESTLSQNSNPETGNEFVESQSSAIEDATGMCNDSNTDLQVQQSLEQGNEDTPSSSTLGNNSSNVEMAIPVLTYAEPQSRRRSMKVSVLLQ